MDGVWHLNAPQWTDFESSPQIPDDNYFDREHQELEPKLLFADVPAVVVDKVAKKVAEKVPEKVAEKVPDVKESAPKSKLKISEAYREKSNDDSLLNEIEIAKMTPVKVAAPKSKNRNNCPKGKQITYDNVLSEAMASLQLSIKKNSRRSQAVRNATNVLATPTNAEKLLVAKTLNLLKGPRSTPSNPIPMWIRKTRPSEKSLEKGEGTEDLRKDSIKGDADAVAVTSGEPANAGIGELEEPEAPEDQDVMPVVDDVEIPKNIQILGPNRGSTASLCSNKAQRAKFSTCQLRRRSLTQYRRRSNKYVSLAEALRKFETGTPKRFRSVSTKNPKPGPVQKVRQSSITATVPISPALRCKSRTRPTTVLSKEERERLEVEEMRKHSVRENIARANSVKTLAQNPAKTTLKKANAAETESKIQHPNPEKKGNRESRLKVTVPSVVSTEEGLAVKDAEISNFGVPDITTAKPIATKTMPFSFELRNKELQKKKEQKIKELLIQEDKKTKVPFHARPVPTFKKPMIAGASKEPGATKSMTKLCPFSFEARDKNLMKRKEEKIKIVLEEDKKARNFQATPLPEFKPVLVRGVSKENLNSGNKPLNPPPAQKLRISMLPVSRTNSRGCLLIRSVSNQENQNPSLKPGTQLPKPKPSEDKMENQHRAAAKVLAEFHLNTDKRAKDRREFDERVKQKEQEIELMRKDAEVEKLMREEKERTEIRRMAETKARPMPAYKPPTIVHSDKALTNPQSPGWATKSKR